MSTNPELLNTLQTARDNYIAACGGDIATANTYIAKIVWNLQPGFGTVTLKTLSEAPELAAAVMAKLAAGPEAPPRSAFDIVLDAIEALPAQCTAEGKTDIYTRITGARNVLTAEQLSALVQALQRKLPKKSVQEIRDELDVRWHGKASPAATTKSRKPLVFDKLPRDILTLELPEQLFALGLWLPLGTTSLLVAQGGFGKSYLLLMMAVCIALGLEFNGRPCTAGRVVIVTGEDRKAELFRRVQKILKYIVATRGIAIDHDLLAANFDIVDRVGCGAENMMVQAQHNAFIPTDLPEFMAEQIGSAVLIVFDTKSRFAGGDENSNAAGSALVAAGELVAARTGAAVVFVAHTGKLVAREGVVDMYSIRGASSLADDARSVMVLAPPTDKQKKQYDFDPAGLEVNGEFRMAHVKHSYSTKADDLFLQRTPHGVVAPFTPTQRDVVTEEDRTWQLLKHIGPGEITRNKVKNAELKAIFGEGFARDGATDIFDSAVKEGLLTHKRNYKNADYYKLSDGALKELAARAEIEAAAQRKDDAEFNAPYARAPQLQEAVEEAPNQRKERKPRKPKPATESVPDDAGFVAALAATDGVEIQCGSLEELDGAAPDPEPVAKTNGAASKHDVEITGDMARLKPALSTFVYESHGLAKRDGRQGYVLRGVDTATRDALLTFAKTIGANGIVLERAA